MAKPMNIIDLTSEYIKHIVNAGDLASYEKSYPALFQHYFRYWAKRKNFSKTLNKSEVKKRLNLIEPRLSRVEKKINSSGLNISFLKIVLFVGQSTCNGHVFKDNKEFIVWIPIETYSTPLQVDVFITHEIIHSLHYLKSPDFYFNNFTEKRLISRQFITEGVATYLTKHIIKITQSKALWADFLSKEKTKIWFRECQQKEKELYKFVLKNFSSTNPEISLFYAKNPRNIYEFRAGYFVGLKLVDQMVKNKKMDPKKLLEIPRKKFEKMILEELRLGCVSC